VRQSKTASTAARRRRACRRRVAVDPDSGLGGYDVSYVNATDLHTVAKPRLHRRRGLLRPGEMAMLEDAIRLYLGL
jgi:mRNA interferase MazF